MATFMGFLIGSAQLTALPAGELMGVALFACALLMVESRHKEWSQCSFSAYLEPNLLGPATPQGL